MAMLAADDDPEKKAQAAQQAQSPQAQAPTLSGGGSAITGGAAQPTTGASSPPTTGIQAPAASSTGGNGTGSGSSFINLQSYIGANKGNDRAAKVQNAGANIIGGEQANFNAQAQPLRNANYSAARLNDDQAQQQIAWENGAPSGNEKRGTSTGSGEIRIGPDGKQLQEQPPDQNTAVAPYASLKSLINQQYGGPGAMNYQIGGQSDTDLQSLSNNKTSLDVLARPSIQNSTYGMTGNGSRGLDEALMGADQRAQTAQQGVGDARTAFLGKTGAEQGSLNAKVGGFAADAASARAEAQSQATRFKGLGALVAPQTDVSQLPNSQAPETQTQEAIRDHGPDAKNNGDVNDLNHMTDGHSSVGPPEETAGERNQRQKAAQAAKKKEAQRQYIQGRNIR